jgi:ribosomal protein S18 acetylase RimI-like enzyme
MQTIRPALPDDAGAVTALVRAAYAHYVPRIGYEPQPMKDDYAALIAAGRVSVLERDGELLGVLVLIVEPGILYLDNIAVAPAAKGMGLGRVLLDHAEAEARRRGFGAIRLLTNEKMTENQAIYAARGYRETHRETLADGRRAVFMRKDLA